MKYYNECNTVEVKDEEGVVTTNEFDYIGRLIKQTDSRNNDVNIKYDRNNNVVEIKTAENITNKFEYDKESRLTKEIDGENHFVSYEYDGIGNILKKTTEGNEITTYTYDKHNVMTSMTDALGNTERYETNLNKQVTKKIQKDGTIYHYNYDRAKRLVNTVAPMNYRINLIYSIGDDIIKTKDTLGRQVNYEYDILHNQTKKIDANSNIELYTYDYRGNITKKIDRRESVDKYTYDLTDNLIEWTDANNNKTTYTYDKVGNILEFRQHNGALTKYEYDNNYNRIKLTNPRGKITTYSYDRDNRLISETDPLGNVKRYDYNRNNNLTKFTSSLGNIQQYVYDTDNNLIKEIDSKNNVKQYTYDKLHRLTKTISELNNTAEFSYDIVDNVIGIKDPKGTNTVFDYNAVGKVVQERSVDNTIRTYNYDRAGRLISKVNKDHTRIAYDYDANDNLVKKYYIDLNNQQIDDDFDIHRPLENRQSGKMSTLNDDEVKFDYNQDYRYFAMKSDQYYYDLSEMSMILANMVNKKSGINRRWLKDTNYINRIANDSGGIGIEEYRERYNAYSIEEYMQYIGLEDIEVRDMSSTYEDSNVCRYAIGHRDVVYSLGRTQNVVRNVIAISIGDIESKAAELYANFDGHSGKEGSNIEYHHTGFDIVANRIIETLERYAIRYDPRYQKVYWITGEGGGGSVANLLAQKLIKKYGNKNIYCYTFQALNTINCNNIPPVQRIINEPYGSIFNLYNDDNQTLQIYTNEANFYMYGVRKHEAISSSRKSIGQWQNSTGVRYDITPDKYYAQNFIKMLIDKLDREMVTGFAFTETQIKKIDGYIEKIKNTNDPQKFTDLHIDLVAYFVEIGLKYDDKEFYFEDTDDHKSI